MPDIYATISEQPQDVQERIIEVLNLRADEPEMQAMLDDYLSALDVPDDARVLEIGSGAGAATRKIAEHASVGQVTALDPSPVFLERARKTLADLDHVAFVEGDARSLEFDDESFELVLAHTVLCHVPKPEEALAEAYRVLVPGGQIVIFDGDYTTMNVAAGDFDPLQRCVDCALSNYVHDQWFMRRLSKMVDTAGFKIRRSDGHGYVQVTDPKYLLTVIDRGAEAIASTGTIGSELAAALKAEARRRVEEKQFYGVIMFGSLVAEKPL